MKKCSKCKKKKEIDEFSKNRSRADGRNHYCRLCSSKKGKKYREDNLEKERGRVKRYRASLPDGVLREAHISYRNRRPEVFLAKELKRRLRKYGISKEKLEEMRSVRTGCYICGGADKNKDLSIDHDHLTGRVRGLLCSRCNLCVGKAEDNPELLRKMADYLEVSNE